MRPSVATRARTGRYAIYGEIAAGGMATVHLARLAGPVSFSRTVAVKRLHEHLATRRESVRTFLEEARLTAHVRHTNVVSTLDIVTSRDDTFLVMEYVHGDTVARLLEEARRRGEPVPVPVACSIAVGFLSGLHAAHEATGERGERLEIVHCDVSPQNVMVGTDGVARVIDFGIAQAAGWVPTGREGVLEGKLAYAAPEVVRGRAVTRAADIYSAAVVLWEMLTGRRLFSGDNDGNVLERVLFAEVMGPSKAAGHVPAELDAIVLGALSRDPLARFATARDLARAIETVVPIADASEVGEWVDRLAGAALAARARDIARIESEARAATGDADDELGAVRHDRSGDLPAFDAGLAASDPRTGGVEWGARSAVRVSPAAPPRPPPRRRVPGATIGAVAIGLGVGAIVLVAIARRPASAPPAAAAAPGAIAPAPSAQPVSTPVATPGAPAAAAPPTAPRPAPNRGAPARPAVANDAPVKPTAPKDPPRCSPPWTIGDGGIKQYKLECL